MKSKNFILHQFPLSHYCEKARLGLQIKDLEYQTENYMPMWHVLNMYRISGQRQVPVLQNGTKAIAGSTAILEYLDTLVPEPALFFSDAKQNHKLIQFMNEVDVGVGIHLRRFFYSVLLNHPDLMYELFAGGDEFSKIDKFLCRASFPIVKQIMLRGLKINPRSAERSKTALLKIMDKLDQKIGKKAHFFQQLTAADLTVASLLAPLVKPLNHPFDWQRITLPDQLELFCEEQSQRPVYQWVQKFYAKM